MAGFCDIGLPDRPGTKKRLRRSRSNGDSLVADHPSRMMIEKVAQIVAENRVDESKFSLILADNCVRI